MNQTQLNRAVARATGEDVEVIASRGFDVVEVEANGFDDDWDALIVDWEQLQAEGNMSLLPTCDQPSIAC
jgi:hypothetical protein